MKWYFTITAGRTGSAWMADFLNRNIGIPAIHEPLDIYDFGVRMPDIRTMRLFNHEGNNEEVQKFWFKKFETINGDYIETNHTLAKAGLVENLKLNNLSSDTTLIILRRDIRKQCLSYLTRNDFANITIAWQWYLHPSYKKKFINPEVFKRFGAFGVPLWYCYEMLARQEYYKQRYSSFFNIIEVDLDSIVSGQQTNDFARSLGIKNQVIIPAQKNASTKKIDQHLQENLNKIITTINFDAQAIVSNAIKNGFTFET